LGKRKLSVKRIIKKLTTSSKKSKAQWVLSSEEFVWSVGSFCALSRIPFDHNLLLQQYSPPYTTDSLIKAMRDLGFKCKIHASPVKKLDKLTLPFLAVMKNEDKTDEKENEAQVSVQKASCVIVSDITLEKVVLFKAGTNTPIEMTIESFQKNYLGFVILAAKQNEDVNDPDAVSTRNEKFGFRWFIPELLRYKRVWRDVLLASLVIHMLALGTPLFTQVIIDKVVVHQTQSTLIAIGIGLAVFMIFSSLLTWVRQYLVLHTGNRVDAVLASNVFDHLFKLPPRYFEMRPTGVIAARLQGVETIREFIAGAAVTLILDLPFMLIFIAVMFFYSVELTMIVLGILTIIGLISFFIAPVFQAQLNQQFLLGARNQAFMTEYIVGVETVKSLQMEPQLRSRFSDYLADYLNATFKTRQLANTYNVSAGLLEQLMTMLILIVGAYIVMTSTDFTIGMLVAFQMFAGKLSQPMMRMVGLWQQFQQADLSVKRLGDVMDAPAEPYSVLPTRLREGNGLIEIDGLSFRYNEQLPYLYENFEMTVEPGKTVAIMGPSGSGKSTFAKLLQGFYQPTDGRIRIDGTEINHLSANELRHYFGVVPQETMLFSGTIFHNLQSANPHATFDQIIHACKLAEIHNVIEQLPNGYQTEIGERGSGLSGGQRQRLAIARALIKRPKILVFDEATSALDHETAEQFATTVNQLKGKVTMLFITHALPKSLKVDEIVHIGGKSSTSVIKNFKREEVE